MTGGTDRQTLLAEWTGLLARATPGSRRAIDKDMPLYAASVRVAKLEQKLAQAMVMWLSDEKQAEPWELIEKALTRKTGDTCWMGVHAIKAICTVRQNAWDRAVEAFARAPSHGKQKMLTEGFGPRRDAALLIRAAADPDEEVRLSAAHLAARHPDSEIFPKVFEEVNGFAQSPSAEECLKEYEWKYRSRLPKSSPWVKAREHDIPLTRHRGSKCHVINGRWGPRKLGLDDPVLLVCGFFKRLSAIDPRLSTWLRADRHESKMVLTDPEQVETWLKRSRNTSVTGSHNYDLGGYTTRVHTEESVNFDLSFGCDHAESWNQVSITYDEGAAILRDRSKILDVAKICIETFDPDICEVCGSVDPPHRFDEWVRSERFIPAVHWVVYLPRDKYGNVTSGTAWKVEPFHRGTLVTVREACLDLGNLDDYALAERVREELGVPSKTHIVPRPNV